MHSLLSICCCTITQNVLHIYENTHLCKWQPAMHVSWLSSYLCMTFRSSVVGTHYAQRCPIPPSTPSRTPCHKSAPPDEGWQTHQRPLSWRLFDSRLQSTCRKVRVATLCTAGPMPSLVCCVSPKTRSELHVCSHSMSVLTESQC